MENYNNTAIVPQSDRTPVMTIHHKITDVFTGDFLGVISMDVELNKLRQIADSLINKQQEAMYLINENNQIILSSDTNQISNPVSEDLKTKLQGKTDHQDIVFFEDFSFPVKWLEVSKSHP